MKQTIAAVAAILMLASCQVNYDKTPSGLVYKIFPGKGGEKATPGKFVKLYVTYTIPEKKDSVLYSNFGQVPGYEPVDTAAKTTSYSYREIIPKMSVGDSAIIIVSVDTLKNRKLLPDYNDVLVKGSHIKCVMKVMGVYNSENDFMADLNKEKDIEKGREVKSIEDYLAKNNIKAQKTKNGVYISVEVPGDTSNMADSGKTAVVMYKGYLPTGKVFDTNMDSSKGHTNPLEVQVGQAGIIPAWNEALPYFGKGSKGKIFVPAMMGFGEQSPGPEIPAYSNLVFDIEVKDVKPTPPPPPMTDKQKMQMMQQMQQQQQQQQQGGQ